MISLRYQKNFIVKEHIPEKLRANTGGQDIQGADELRPEKHAIPSQEFEGRIHDFYSNIPSELNEFFAQHELYPPDHTVAVVIQDRLNRISTDKQRYVYVVHDQTPNAFAFRDACIVTDSLLAILPNQEALDFLLAHEYIHNRDHHTNAIPTRLVERLGKSRANELSADLLPIMHLDDLGINPTGYIDLTKALESYLKAQHDQTQGPKALVDQTKLDVEHGSLQDRRVIIAQGISLINLQSLSDSRERLPYATTELEGFTTFEDLDNSWETLHPTQKLFLILHFSAKPEWTLEENRDRSKKFSVLVVKRLTELLDTPDPNLVKALCGIAHYARDSWEDPDYPKPRIATAGDLTTTIPLFMHPIWQEIGLRLDIPELISRAINNWIINGNPTDQEFINMIQQLSEVYSEDPRWYTNWLNTNSRRMLFERLDFVANRDIPIFLVFANQITTEDRLERREPFEEYARSKMLNLPGFQEKTTHKVVGVENPLATLAILSYGQETDTGGDFYEYDADYEERKGEPSKYEASEIEYLIEFFYLQVANSSPSEILSELQRLRDANRLNLFETDKLPTTLRSGF